MQRQSSYSVLIGVLCLTLSGSALLAFAQPGRPKNEPSPRSNAPGRPNAPGRSELTPAEAKAKIAQDREAAFGKRLAHPKCPNCFRIDKKREVIRNGVPEEAPRYGIYEEVPSTDVILTRDIPDPAPLEPGEVRPQVHPKTGEPLWYKGRQAFVGPTDEEIVSKDIPHRKIDLMRIQARNKQRILSTLGVHSFGIGGEGFIIKTNPEDRENINEIPSSLEEIPVTVLEEEIPITKSHASEFYAPVPSGVQIARPGVLIGGELFDLLGTLGPHIVRDASNIGSCCQIWSLTNAHVVKVSMSDPTPSGAIIKQGGQAWGHVSHTFSPVSCGALTRCAFLPDPIINDTRITPDIATLTHIDMCHMDTSPHSSPCDGSREPVRRLRFGSDDDDFVHGPTGIIEVGTLGKEIKVWGAVSHAPKGTIQGISTFQLIQERTGDWYWFFPVDWALLDDPSLGGDSGALVTENGTKDVAGVAFAGFPVGSFFGSVIYFRAFDIMDAYENAGLPFHHYWGTNSLYRSPSINENDVPCN